MWESAIHAIKNGEVDWIKANRNDFRIFFKSQNLKDQGKLSEEALRYHYDHGLFKMFTPKEYGGLEMSPVAGGQMIENASRLNGSWGWLLAIGVGGSYFLDYIDEPLRSSLFKPADALVAGSGKPSGKTFLDGEFYVVNGQWDYCSGSENASFFSAVTQLNDRPIGVVLPKSQIFLKRNWNTFGLELTCSHTIVAENVKVDRAHFFDLSDKPVPSAYPISNYPFDLFARICFVPVIIGLSRAFWVEIHNMLKPRLEHWQQVQPGKYHKVQSLISRFEKSFEEQCSAFYETVDRSWENHLKGKNLNASGLQRTGLDLSSWCYNSGSEILPYLGMEIMNVDHPVQNCWKDLRTAYQHMIFRDYSL